MASSFNQIFRGAAGTSGDTTNVEDLFSTYLYEGTGATPTITNGIDLAGEGGLVWIKNRDATDSHILTDTVRGATKVLVTDTTAAEDTDADTITSFTGTGFVLGADVKVNTSAESYASFSFREAPNFFDVVTYTGNGTAGRTIAHSLGTTVGMLIIKELGGANDWDVLHRSTEVLRLNSTAGPLSGYAPTRFGDGSSLVRPTSSVFTVGDSGEVNGDGQTYVAYLFAHNASGDGGFGSTGDQDIIKCGSYTGNGNATGPVIDLGWEPQWLLTKAATRTSDWSIVDSMRGVHTGGVDQRLHPQSSEAEPAAATHSVDMINFNAEGFNVTNSGTIVNGNTETYIYVAIRRPNMATITDATEVFAVAARTGTDASGASSAFVAGFPVDFAFQVLTTGNATKYATGRLITNIELLLNTAGAAGGASNYLFESMTGWNKSTGANSNIYAWMWKRAKGFFDLLCYTGTGSALNVSHSLAVAPEMMWIKNRGVADPWAVYYGDNTDYLILDTDAATDDDAAWWNDTSPTASVFTVNTDHSVNASGENYTALLFATLAGVSKVGTVTHSGSSTDVDCGFSAGARFVLLKRTDATGDWYYWDSVRGIVAGNDPYSLINTTAVDVTDTDLIDPLASGFQISGDFTDGDYIFYAIA